MTQLAAETTETMQSRSLPPGPKWPGPVQTVWYTFAQPSFFAAARAGYGLTWTMRLPNFPPLVVTRDRDAIRRLFTGDPLVRRHGNDLFKSAFGERSVMLLEPAEHLNRRRTELPPFHGQAVRSYTDRIQQLITTKLEAWTPDRVLATHPPARAVTLEIILGLVLGVRDPKLQAELAAIFDSFNTPLSKLALFLPSTLGRRAWWNPIAKPAFARVDRMRALLSAHIARTRTDPLLDQRDDVLAVLVRAQDQDGRAELGGSRLRNPLTERTRDECGRSGYRRSYVPGTSRPISHARQLRRPALGQAGPASVMRVLTIVAPLQVASPQARDYAVRDL